MIDASNGPEKGPIHEGTQGEAIERGDEETVRRILSGAVIDVNRKDEYGQIPLAHAAQEGRASIVEVFLEHGQSDVNSKENVGRTPLALAAIDSSTQR